MNLGSDDEKEKKENITVKGIPSLEELKEANDYKITTFDRQYYRFTPSSEGQYIISLKQEDNDYNNVNVWTYGKLYDNQWETCIVEKAYEGENNYSVQLEAGREYLVSALGEVNDPEASFHIHFYTRCVCLIVNKQQINFPLLFCYKSVVCDDRKNKNVLYK